MTALCLADAREAADLAAFLGRLIHYDRAAAVRMQAGGGVVAVFGRPPSFEVLAVRTARLAAGAAPRGGRTAGAPEEPWVAGVLDVTVSAGQLADAIDTALRGQGAAAPGMPGPGVPAPGGGAGVTTVGADARQGTGELRITVPPAVTGPPWAGVLPPRGGWRQVGGLPGSEEIRGAVAAAVTEFRSRMEALPHDRRTRAELDRIGREIWSRTLGGTRLPLRAAHAAQSLGFLRPAPAEAAVAAAVSGGPGASRNGVRGNGAATAVAAAERDPLALLAADGWLRLRTPYGSIVVRQSGLAGLTVTPA